MRTKYGLKWAIFLCAIIVLCTGCALAGGTKNYFETIDLTKDEESATVDAVAYVNGEEGFYYMDVAENMEVKVRFTLTNEQENTDIVYVTSDGYETVISDPKAKDTKVDTIDMILLEGPCYFKLIGKNAKCSLEFTMDGIDYSAVNYLDFKSPEQDQE